MENQKGNIIIGVLLGLLILVIGLFAIYYFKNQKNTSMSPPQITELSPTSTPASIFSPSPQPNTTTYKNPLLGYQFIYPKQYYIRDYNNFFKKVVHNGDDGRAVITDIDENSDWTKASFSISITPMGYMQITHLHEATQESSLTDTKKFSFKDYVEQTLLPYCDASGVQGETYCDKITSIEPYSNSDGLSGYKVYLHSITTGMDAEQHIKGPFYILDISDKNLSALLGNQQQKARALMISYSGPVTQKEQELKDIQALSLLENIVNSIKF